MNNIKKSILALSLMSFMGFSLAMLTPVSAAGEYQLASLMMREAANSIPIRMEVVEYEVTPQLMPWEVSAEDVNNLAPMLDVSMVGDAKVTPQQAIALCYTNPENKAIIDVYFSEKMDDVGYDYALVDR